MDNHKNEIIIEGKDKSTKPVLSIVSQKSLLFCTCGKIVEFKDSPQGERYFNCTCGTKTTRSKHGGIVVMRY